MAHTYSILPVSYTYRTSICHAQFQEASDSTPSTVTTASRFVACYSQHFNQRPSWVQSGQSYSFHHHIAKHFMTKCVTPMFAKSAASACVCASVCVCEGPLLAFRASRFIQATSRNIAKNCSPGSGFKKCLSHFGPFDFASNDWRLWAWQLGGMSCDGMWKRERGKLAHAFCIPSCSYRVFSLSHIAI